MLETIIGAGEQVDIEFKGERSGTLSDDDIVEAVVCLGNLPATHDRGLLLIGVENDGTVTGARPRQGTRADPDRLRALIFGRTEPAIDTRIAVIDVGGKDVVAIEVERQNAVCATKQGKSVRRVLRVDGPGCDPFYPHEHQSYRSDLGLVDTSAQTLDDLDETALDPLEIERLRRTADALHGDRRLGELDDLEVAKALNLVTTQGSRLVPTVAGLLLVGRQEVLNRIIPNHDIRFQVFDPTDDVVANESLREPLLRALENVNQRFVARNSEQEVLVGMIRLPIPDYAPDAFREAVSNAVLHRDYGRNNAVYVQWYPDQIGISNPGGFVSGITLDNLLVHEPKPRNPLLANAFLRIGLVERTGRGVARFSRGCCAMAVPCRTTHTATPMGSG